MGARKAIGALLAGLLVGLSGCHFQLTFFGSDSDPALAEESDENDGDVDFDGEDSDGDGIPDDEEELIVAVGVGDLSNLPTVGPLEGGVVTYVLGEQVLLHALAGGGSIVPLGAGLDPLFEGEDEGPYASRSGEWLTVTTTRFDCADFACLALVRRDYSYARRVVAGGSRVHPSGRAAVNDAADVIVFASSDGPHSVDLFVIRRTGNTWSAPALLTEGSTEEFNEQPMLRPDGGAVLFDCGPTAFSQSDTDICEVLIDGSGFAKRVDSAAHPLGVEGVFNLTHADYAPDGSIVFEADWDGEQVWRVSAGATPTVINVAHTNDNSPCVFPDGQVASLWLNRPGGAGLHELKIMGPGGDGELVLTPDVDVANVGMSCSGPN